MKAKATKACKFLALLMAMSSSPVYAVQTTGTITSYTSTKWNVFLFTVSNKVNSIACDINRGYGIPTDTAWGKAAIATVIAAATAGKTVTVVGEDKCSYWSNDEDMAYISVAN